MGTISKTQNIGYAQINNTYTIEVDLVANLNNNLVGGVVVALTVPGGVTVDSTSLPKGAYNGGTKKWEVGTLLPGESLTGTFTFRITDDSLIPYAHVFDLSAQTGCIACFADESLEVTVVGVSCANVKSCLGSVPAYDDNAAALGGGLVAGNIYQTTGSGAAPLNAAGILMVVQ